MHRAHITLEKLEKMKKTELVFIPFPAVGHLVSAVEMAKRIVAQDDGPSVSVLITKLLGFESSLTAYMQSLASISERIKFIHLPYVPVDNSNLTPVHSLSSFFENLKPQVRNAVKELVEPGSDRPDSPRLAGFVVDMFSTEMIDVAEEFGVPSYVFFTSGAGYLRLMTHLQALSDDQNEDIFEYKYKPDSELVVPGFENPVPAKVLPDILLMEKADCSLLLSQYKKMREKSKGVLVNTFMELDSNMVRSLPQVEFPPIYPVGPFLNLHPNESHVVSGGTNGIISDIVTWLDSQLPSSVVFLCFGSMGSFSREQVKEIAWALEHSGVRFLWSLRKPLQVGSPITINYADPNEVLPDGFLNRTAGIGKIIGWAPQVTVLAHPAIGGFMSHCGWNSILESLWFGVPIATWPLYAEQQINAFKMVREYGLAVEFKLDYKKDLINGETYPAGVLVRAEEIERGFKKLMEDDNDIRKRVKEMSEKSKEALLDGGSSYSSLCRFIRDVIENIR